MLQLCLYSELVSSVQGLTPEYPYVVAPWSDYEPQIFRMDDYAAYYRQVRDGLARAVEDHGGKEIYPDPKPHCDICRWQHRCDQRRRADDHLSLVAGISKIQIDELKRQGVETTADLAVMPLPLGWKPARGATYSYERIREQARIQVEGRQPALRCTNCSLWCRGLACKPAGTLLGRYLLRPGRRSLCYGFTRETKLSDANTALVKVQACLLGSSLLAPSKRRRHQRVQLG